MTLVLEIPDTWKSLLGLERKKRKKDTHNFGDTNEDREMELEGIIQATSQGRNLR